MSQRSRRYLIPAILLLGLCAAQAGSFTLFGFRSWTQIQNGNFFTWKQSEYGAPFELSFAIQSDILSNQPGGTAFSGSARGAVVSALESWSAASHGFITFEEAPWSPVPNDNNTPRPAWEGPPLDEWDGDLSNPFGWGANIDVFSRPTGFTIESGEVQFVMSPTTLAFTIVSRNNNYNRIRSVDIYLNESFNWSTTGQQSRFDVETVVLHEVGHALGLDHPKDAVEMGSVNLDPHTFLPGWPWSTADVMHPVYTGIKRELTIDEIGALRFLYGVESESDSLPGDVNGDGVVNSQDLALVLGSWGVCPDPPVPCISDINGDGLVNAQDLAVVLANWGSTLAGAD